MVSLASQLGPGILIAALVLYSYYSMPERRRSATQTPAPPVRVTEPAPIAAPARDPFEVPSPAPLAAESETGAPDPRAPELRRNTSRKVSVHEQSAQLTLAGTFIRGGQRLAVIDGRIYSEGMAVAESEPELIVHQIAPDHIVLGRGAEQAAIGYETIDGKPAGQPETPHPTRRTAP